MRYILGEGYVATNGDKTALSLQSQPDSPLMDPGDLIPLDLPTFAQIAPRGQPAPDPHSRRKYQLILESIDE